MSDEEVVDEKKVAKKAAPKKAAVKKAVVKKAAAAPEAASNEAVATSKAAPEKAAAAKSDPSVKRLSVTLVRSKHHRLATHKACAAGLGLRRMHQTVQVIDTPENRGMINRIHYMLNVEEV